MFEYSSPIHWISAGGGANGVVRRPSKRQQEKAPEGRAPHTHNVNADHEEEGQGADTPGQAAPGPAPEESKFTEDV